MLWLKTLLYALVIGAVSWLLIIFGCVWWLAIILATAAVLLFRFGPTLVDELL